MRPKRPFLIKKFPCNTVVLRAKSGYCKKAQELLKMSQGRISCQLSQAASLLFIRVGGEILYLEFEDEPLAERALRFGRSISDDLMLAYSFKTELYVKKNGWVYHVKDYKSYSEAGRQLGLTSQPELNGFCQVAAGKTPSSHGWKLVYKL
jgi:hypothetical protein